MAIHQQAFREELFLEHLEEAAFQYETRTVWLCDSEVGWQDLEDIDFALEAHIDALMIGETLALKVCLEVLPEADFSTLHIILRVFCRHRLIDRLNLVWKEFDFADPQKVSAAADALKWDCPEEWLVNFLQLFPQDVPGIWSVLSSSFTYRHRDLETVLFKGLVKAEARERLDILDALVQCEKSTKGACEKHLATLLQKHDDAQLVSRVATIFLVMGDQRGLQSCRSRVKDLPLVFAVGGNHADAQKLFEQAVAGTADEDCLLAMALSGMPQAIPQLIAYLQHPDLAQVAAGGLNLISGAELYEDKHVADDVEKAELFDHELEAFKQGELPKNIDGDPFGREVSQPCVEPERWQRWFDKNRSVFNAGLRYRNGKLLTPLELVKNLIDNQCAYKIRKLIHLELVIRYGLEAKFAADDLVALQKQALNSMHKWALAISSEVVAGAWYFNLTNESRESTRVS